MVSMTDNQVKEMILAARKEASEHIQAIKTASVLNYELVHREVSAYIKCKFHLTDTDCVTDNFRELAELSLAKSAKISPELVKEFDLARSCDGVSSQTAKMVLLFMALQKDLEIQFQPDETAEAETLGDISKLVWQELKNQLFIDV